MKYFICLFLLSACSATKANQKINIYDVLINVDSSCQTEFISKSKTQIFSYSFNQRGKCRFITHSKTNVAHIQFVNGMYVLLVENNIKEGDECYSEYSAFGIDKESTVYTTDRIKKSGSCYQDKDAKAFEYFSALLKPSVNIR